MTAGTNYYRKTISMLAFGTKKISQDVKMYTNNRKHIRNIVVNLHKKQSKDINRENEYGKGIDF
jgi:hypothetical protein